MRIRGLVNPASGIWDGKIGSEIRNTVYDNRIHAQNRLAGQTSEEWGKDSQYSTSLKRFGYYVDSEPFKEDFRRPDTFF